MKKYTIGILWFICAFWILTGCVVVVNNNMGHHIKVEKKHDLHGAGIAKDYTADIESKRR